MDANRVCRCAGCTIIGLRDSSVNLRIHRKEYMSKNDDAFEKALPLMAPMLKVVFDRGLEQGFAQGFNMGHQLGYVAGVNDMTSAVSDGLRHGSSECGKKMQQLKNLGLNTEPGKAD